MNDTQLPINLLSWVLAAAPILILLFLLAGLRWSATDAAPFGLFAAAAVSLLAFQTPWGTLAVAGGKGVWDAFAILAVVWPALLLYQVGDRAGAFAALQQEIQRFSRNELFLVLAFGWVFASFLQGVAGFGVPAAVAAPLLFALGVRPVYAVLIPLIGHAWGNMFGTLGVGWLATTQVVNLEDPTGTAVQSAILLWAVTLVSGFTIAWLYGKMPAVRLAWPMVLIISTIHGGVQLLLMFWQPVLSNFLAATVALAALYPLTRWQRYSEPAEGITDRPAMQEEDSDEAEEEEDEPEPVMGLGMAFLPYAVLTVVAVLVSAIPPVEAALGQFAIGPAFPQTATGFGVVNEATEQYSSLTPLTHPGAFLLVASAVAYAVYRSRGYFRAWGERSGETQGIWSGVVGNAVPSSVAIVAFLILAGLLGDTGQIEVLAVGISEATPPVVYAFLANFIGILGALVTSSSTSSQVLFGPLQETAAANAGLPEAPIIAAQSTGGSVGNVVAPVNIALALATVGAAGKDGDVLRQAIPWAIAVGVITGVLTIVLALITSP